MTFSYKHTIHFIVFTLVTLSCSPPTSLILFFFPACPSSPFKTSCCCWWWWWWCCCCCCCCWWWWCCWHCWWWWWPFITVVCRGIGQGYLQEHRDQCLQPWRKLCLLLSSTTSCHRLSGSVGGELMSPSPSRAGWGQTQSYRHLVQNHRVWWLWHGQETVFHKHFTPSFIINPSLFYGSLILEVGNVRWFT